MKTSKIQTFGISFIFFVLVLSSGCTTAKFNDTYSSKKGDAASSREVSDTQKKIETFYSALLKAMPTFDDRKARIVARGIVLKVKSEAVIAPVKSVHYENVKVNKATKNTIINAIDIVDRDKIKDLYNALLTLGSNIDKKEAQFIAREAVLYPKILANRYKLMSPPFIHNALVNYGCRERGLCYQWTHDMGKQLNRPSKSFQFYHGVAFRHDYWNEHSTLIISAKGKGVSEGIVLDPWRNSGVLFWSHVKNDKKYPWVNFLSTINKSRRGKRVRTKSSIEKFLNCINSLEYKSE